MKKFLEFLSNPFLRQLLVLSAEGRSVEFVNYFNSLTESQTPSYHDFKLWFYDINQRKFIIQAHT